MSTASWNTLREWLSLFGAAGAGWANFYAVWAWRGSRWVQTFYGATGFMAWFYGWGYVYLIVTSDTFGWSHFYRNFGPLVWVMVWTVPAIASAKAHRETIYSIEATSAIVTKALTKRTDEGFDLSE